MVSQTIVRENHHLLYVGVNVYTSLCFPVPECKTADWSASLEKQGWSECPKHNAYLKGLWRNVKTGYENVGLIDYGKCCDADEPCYTLQPATCSTGDWSTLLNR